MNSWAASHRAVPLCLQVLVGLRTASELVGQQPQLGQGSLYTQAERLRMTGGLAVLDPDPISITSTNHMLRWET